MKKADVQIGGKYLAKVSGKVVPVRIDAESRFGGWDATNLITNRPVRIKNAQRLRGPAVKSVASATATQLAEAAETDEKPDTEPRQQRSGSSGLDAAEQVLREAGEPLNARQIVERMLAQGLWTTNGKTPHATIYAAIIREIQHKGDASRFCKVERGKFALKDSQSIY